MARPRKNAAAAAKAAKTEEAVKTEAQTVEVEAAEKVEEAAGKAEKVTKKAAESAAKVTKKAAESAAKAAEKAVEEVKKAAEEVKKAPAKKTAVKEEFFLQFGGNEISQTDIIKKVKENWTKVQKKKIKDIKKISVYLVPENGCAYYVINGEGSDDYKVEL